MGNLLPKGQSQAETERTRNMEVNERNIDTDVRVSVSTDSAAPKRGEMVGKVKIM